MEITDVQVKLIGNGDDRLKASCTIALDAEFVIRDVKVIEGTNGLFVAMPSRKLTDHCSKCGCKNHLRSRYCNQCGTKLDDSRWTQKGGATQLHAEIAHPINRDCRERLHKRVIDAYEAARQEHGEAERPTGRETHARADDSPPPDEESALVKEGPPVSEEMRREDVPEPVQYVLEKPEEARSSDPTGDGGISSPAEPGSQDDFGAGLL